MGTPKKNERHAAREADFETWSKNMQYHCRGVAKMKILIPMQHGDAKKKRAPRSMGNRFPKMKQKRVVSLQRCCKNENVDPHAAWGRQTKTSATQRRNKKIGLCHTSRLKLQYLDSPTWAKLAIHFSLPAKRQMNWSNKIKFTNVVWLQKTNEFMNWQKQNKNARTPSRRVSEWRLSETHERYKILRWIPAVFLPIINMCCFDQLKTCKTLQHDSTFAFRCNKQWYREAVNSLLALRF